MYNSKLLLMRKEVFGDQWCPILKTLWESHKVFPAVYIIAVAHQRDGLFYGSFYRKELQYVPYRTFLRGRKGMNGSLNPSQL